AAPARTAPAARGERARTGERGGRTGWSKPAGTSLLQPKLVDELLRRDRPPEARPHLTQRLFDAGDLGLAPGFDQLCVLRLVEHDVRWPIVPDDVDGAFLQRLVDRANSA